MKSANIPQDHEIAAIVPIYDKRTSIARTSPKSWPQHCFAVADKGKP
ncbi:MAG: hypothetical protein IJS96_06765 [Schwartzia sp.]|nr:hypothetical protein [Schwartzia sp. (in: firmicutes)]